MASVWLFLAAAPHLLYEDVSVSLTVAMAFLVEQNPNERSIQMKRTVSKIVFKKKI